MELLRKITRATNLVVLSGMLVLAAGCGGSGDSGDPDPDRPGGAAGTDSAPDVPGDSGADDGLGSNDCDLLTDDEITEVLGPHDGGGQDYLFGGCIWSATSGSGGFTPAVHVAVLDRDRYEALAEIGEPVAEFGDGATYADLYGELWFPCRDNEFCGVKASIAESDERWDVAAKVGRALQERM